MALSGCVTLTYPLSSSQCYLSPYTDSKNFLWKDKNKNERDNFERWWGELIENFGIIVSYQQHGYQLSAHNYIFGEHPDHSFNTPTDLRMLVELQNDSIILSRFGIQSNADVTCFVSISKFKQIFGENSEPKSGDLIYMKEYGNDRPGGRSGAIFQVSERDDELLGVTNTLMGHYVWVLRGTRYVESGDFNSLREAKNDQVYDNTFAGVSNIHNPKLYAQNSEDESKKVFDYDAENVNTSVYGQY